MFTSLRIKYFKKYFSVNVYRTLDTKSVRVEDLNNTDSITSLIFIEISEDNCKIHIAFKWKCHFTKICHMLAHTRRSSQGPQTDSMTYLLFIDISEDNCKIHIVFKWKWYFTKICHMLAHTRRSSQGLQPAMFLCPWDSAC